MIQNSTGDGLFRRLKGNERLRACRGATSTSKRVETAKKKKEMEKKVLEYVLLRSKDDDDEDEEEDTVGKDKVLERGIIEVTENDKEINIREKLLSSFHHKYPCLGKDDFEFIKVYQKRVTTMNLGKGTEYDYTVVKKTRRTGTSVYSNEARVRMSD